MSTGRAVFVVLVIFVAYCWGQNVSEKIESNSEIKSSSGMLIEEGRTFVHHVVKRFMVILPAIFFKLGIAFTLLVLVTLAAVNNGFIGFLILVVGLSSVLARLQQSQSSAPFQVPVPVIGPSFHHHPYVDRRNDDGPVYHRKSERRNDVADSKQHSENSLYAAQISRLNDLLLQNHYAQAQQNSYGNTQAIYGTYSTGS